MSLHLKKMTNDEYLAASFSYFDKDGSAFIPFFLQTTLEGWPLELMAIEQCFVCTNSSMDFVLILSNKIDFVLAALGQCLGGFLLPDYHPEQLERIQLPSALKKQYESRMVQSHKLTGEVDQAALSLFHVLDASVQDVPMPSRQDGNGFKTSTMRLGADAIVFTCTKDNRRLTRSVGLLSYTFLMSTRCNDIFVPAVDVITTIGYLKGAPRLDIYGFNVYHKNSLILVNF
ncbi:hypothetical protein C2845_PM09G12000 [Panicum miliaceum]|uniref:Morc S5 domain-containing protein n=1 Tax=Panicum miliaceum TaxID=4540 RepID=A0A3L6RZ22_PANMI|nr:hypothetical protein C2845_PM09G12000 [Panicum miliaceum]